MYQNIKSCVASEGKLPDFFVSNVVVRQGENVSPLLFSIYVDDLENYLFANGSVPLEVDKIPKMYSSYLCYSMLMTQ